MRNSRGSYAILFGVFFFFFMIYFQNIRASQDDKAKKYNDGSITRKSKGHEIIGLGEDVFSFKFTYPTITEAIFEVIDNNGKVITAVNFDTSYNCVDENCMGTVKAFFPSLRAMES